MSTETSTERVLEGYRATAAILLAAAELAEMQRQPDQAWAYVHSARYLQKLVERHEEKRKP